MKRHLLALLSLLAITSVALAQATFPTFGSLESDGFLTLNRYNLGYGFRVSLPTIPSRGIPFAPGLTYNSFVWQKSGSYWVPIVDSSGVPTWGWGATAAQAERPLFDTFRQRCVANDGSNQWSYVYSNFRTSKASFPYYSIILAEAPDQFPECSDSYPQRSSYGTDSSGLPNAYLLVVNGSGGPHYITYGQPIAPDYGIVQPSVYAPSGSQVDPGNALHDTNGNLITTSAITGGNVWKDTIGRSVLTVQTSTSPHQTTYSYYDQANTAQTATMSLTAENVTTYFQCSGVGEYSQTGLYFPTSITLADGSSYGFDYEASTAPGHPSDITGRISKITLSTGGYIQFSYTGTNCVDGSPLAVTKTVYDGTSSAASSFSRTLSGSTWTTTENTNLANDVVTTFNTDGLPTIEKVYTALTGTTVLKEVATTYSSGGPSRITSIIGAKSKSVDYNYDSYGNQTYVVEYDWNSTSTVLRTTTTTFQYASNYLAAGIANLPLVRKIIVGGTNFSYTEYFYDHLLADGTTDDTAAILMSPVTGAAAHDDSNYAVTSTVPRGNLTRLVQYTSPAGTPSGGLTTLYGYDSLGNVVKSIDPKGNITTIAYTDSWDSGSTSCSIGSGSGAYAYPTTVVQAYTSGIDLTSYAQYNKCIGVTMSTTDPNTQPTIYGYADPLLRLKQVRYADNATGTQSVAYGYTHYVSGTTNAQITTQTLHSSTITTTATTTLDGLGRTQNVMAPTGAKVDYSYAFDTTNHLSKQGVSNPYISTSSGITYTYTDQLGRPAKTVLADASSTSIASYTDNCVTATDPAGLNRKSCIDALGRLQDVYEDPNGYAGQTALNYHTQYLYNGLDSLIGVCQGASFFGTTCPSGSLGRSFSYDGLARLTSETTPEAGTANYYYTDSSGFPCSGDVSQLCRTTDALSVTKTYAYDALNRLTGKSYSDSTSAVAYYYDQSTYNTLSIVNGKGRRTGMSDGSGSTAWSYDVAGNLTKIKKTINGVTKQAIYDYNFDGTNNSLTDYGLTTYTTGYNSSGQLNSLGDGSNTYVSSATYQPSGAPATLVHQLTGSSTSYTRSFSSNVLLQPSLLQAYPTSSSSTPFLKLTYGYGSGGNNGDIASIANGVSGASGRSQTFTYDGVDRLKTATAAVSSSTWGTQYGYDQFGNLTGESVLSGYSTGDAWSTTPTNNKLMSINSYDAAGRATTVNGLATYSYDAEGRVLSSGTTSYVYDGDGYRVKVAGGTTTLYWPGANGKIIDESDSSGTNFGRQVWFGGLLVWNQDPSGNGQFLFQDHLGSTRVTMSSNGTLKDDIDYAPYGKMLINYSGSASTNHYNFTGYETDDTSTSYATYRNLDQVHGRFNRPDPYMGSYDLTDPQSLNRYSYVYNRATYLTDPLGLNVWICSRPIFDNGRDPITEKPLPSTYGDWSCMEIGGGGGNNAPQSDTGGGGTGRSQTVVVPKCSSLGKAGKVAAALSRASKFSGVGYILGLSGNFLATIVPFPGAPIGAGTNGSVSYSFVTDPKGVVGIASTRSATPSFGTRGLGAGINIGSSTFNSLSGYSSYSNVPFQATAGAGYSTGFEVNTNASGFSLTTTIGPGVGAMIGTKGVSYTNDVQPYCKSY